MAERAHDILNDDDLGARRASGLLAEDAAAVRPAARGAGNRTPSRKGASALLKDEAPRFGATGAAGSANAPGRKRVRARDLSKRERGKLSRFLRGKAAPAALAGARSAAEAGSDTREDDGPSAGLPPAAGRAARARRPGGKAAGEAARARHGGKAAAGAHPSAQKRSGRAEAEGKRAARRAEQARRKAATRAAARRRKAARRASEAAQEQAAAAKALVAPRAAVPAAAPVVAAAPTALPLLALVVALVVAAVAIGAVVGEASRPKGGPLEGFPPYITASMVRTALECQEDYGHPAGCTIAQIIAESGMGDTMSQLATRDHNLFGMKWSSAYAGEPEVAGSSSWGTSEEYVPGQSTQITASFIVFKSDEACITFRSRVFLQGSRYRENALIKQAIEQRSSDRMAEGLKDAGWATDSQYVETLKAIMDEWGLRALDSMTVEEWESLLAAGGSGTGQDYASATAAQKVVYDRAMIEPWPGSGLCATWVNRLFTRIGNAPQGYLPYASSYMKWCPGRLDASRLKVGMIVVVPSTVTAPGIGHIGVYMGDGIIRSSESGGVINRSVAEWTAAFCKIAPAYMGWINNRDLSAQ